MGKKMKLPFISKSTETTNSSSWPWVITCANPKTLSFRATIDHHHTFKIMKSEETLLSNPSEAAIVDGDDCIERVIKGLKSERLFFKPDETRLIFEEAKVDDDDEDNGNGVLFKESVAMAIDSNDPFLDFRASMEEMVEAHGIKDWDSLEEMLSCYLRVNGKNNHGYIVGAFVDLLVGIAFAESEISTSTSTSSSADDYHHHCCCSSSTTTTTTTNTTIRSFTSPLSFSSSTCSNSPCLSSLEAEDEIEKSVDNVSCSDDI